MTAVSIHAYAVPRRPLRVVVERSSMGDAMGAPGCAQPASLEDATGNGSSAACSYGFLP